MTIPYNKGGRIVTGGSPRDRQLRVAHGDAVEIQELKSQLKSLSDQVETYKNSAVAIDNGTNVDDLIKKFVSECEDKYLVQVRQLESKVILLEASLAAKESVIAAKDELIATLKNQSVNKLTLLTDSQADYDAVNKRPTVPDVYIDPSAKPDDGIEANIKVDSDVRENVNSKLEKLKGIMGKNKQ